MVIPLSLSISRKLYLAGFLMVGLLLGLFLLNFTTYDRLYFGFDQILQKTETGSQNATVTSNNLASTSSELEQLSANMLALSENIQLLNQRIKEFEGDINEFANDQVFIIEELELVAEEIEDDDVLESLDNVVNSVNTSGEKIGRNGVVSLNAVMQQMSAFTTQINANSANLNVLSTEIEKARELSSGVADVNITITSMATEFEEEISGAKQFLAIVSVIAALGVSIAIFFFTGSIVRPLKQAIGVAKNIANGQFHSDICATSNDEIGELIDAMCSMQLRLNKVISEDVARLVASAKAGDLSQRVPMQGLDGGYRELCLNVNELVDESERIIDDTGRVLRALASGSFEEKISHQYQGKFGQLKEDANQISSSLYNVIEQEIQPLVEQARQGDLNGRINMAGKKGFYRNLSHAINELLLVNENIIGDAARVLGAMARGDLSETIEDNYEGAFASLAQDINTTKEQLSQTIQEDVQSLIDSAKVGNLSQRIHCADKTGVYLSLSEGVNELVTVCENILSETASTFSALANGDLNQTINMDYEGAFDRLKQDANSTVHKLKDVIESDVQSLVNDAQKGELSHRIDTDNKYGFYLELSNGINQLLDTCSQVVEDTSNTFESLAQGDLSASIETEYQGQFDALKKHANATIAKLGDVIEKDIQKIVDNAKHGDLNARIDVRSKQGFFESLSTGINELADVCGEVFDNTAQVAKTLAKGDLTRQIEGDYEGIYADVVGNINDSITQIKNLINRIHTAADVVAQSSVVIATNNQQLEAQTAEQTASVQKASNTMATLSRQIIETANRAEASNAMASDARVIATQGGEVMGQLITAMNTIVESSDKIDSIVELINEIAFQTNLLALNAAVEAARAGESGRGFAVVAAEVRSLALRSSSAAKDVANLITESIENIHEGKVLANQAGDSLQNIVKSVSEVSQSIEMIRTDAMLQKSQVEEAQQSAEEIRQMTNETSQLVSTSYQSANELKHQSEEMNQLINRFRTK